MIVDLTHHWGVGDGYIQCNSSAERSNRGSWLQESMCPPWVAQWGPPGPGEKTQGVIGATYWAPGPGPEEVPPPRGTGIDGESSESRAGKLLHLWPSAAGAPSGYGAPLWHRVLLTEAVVTTWHLSLQHQTSPSSGEHLPQGEGKTLAELLHHST